MSRYICMNCGSFILKSARNDPYICRDCERMFEKEKPERFAYLDEF